MQVPFDDPGKQRQRDCKGKQVKQKREEDDAFDADHDVWRKDVLLSTFGMISLRSATDLMRVASSLSSTKPEATHWMVIVPKNKFCDNPQLY